MKCNYWVFLGMATYENEQNRLRRLLEEVLTDDEVEIDYDDESDNNESDHEEYVIHESESEQDISDIEEDDISNSTSLSYIGNNKVH